ELLEASSGPAEKLSFYDGEITLYYDHKLHAYYVIDEYGDKLLVPGATTVTSMVDKSGPLTQWAANMAVQLLRDKLAKRFNIPALPDLPWGAGPEPVAITIKSDELETLLNEARFAHRAIKED